MNRRPNDHDIDPSDTTWRCLIDERDIGIRQPHGQAAPEWNRGRCEPAPSHPTAEDLTG